MNYTKPFRISLESYIIPLRLCLDLDLDLDLDNTGIYHVTVYYSG
jgi:hypothetical protein